MEESKRKEVVFSFKGSSGPNVDELINMLKALKDVIPEDSKKSLKIEKVEPGSVEIFAFFEPIIDIFMTSNYDVMWDVLGKTSTLVSMVGLFSLPVRLWINKNKKKAMLTRKEVNELIEALKDDPNAIRQIQLDDFKHVKKIAEIVKKRGELVIHGDDNFIKIKEEDASLIEKIVNASPADDEIDDFEARKLHLNICRVSFQGSKEQWRARVLEEDFSKKISIKIEDQDLLFQVEQNNLNFSGKEVIEAMVRFSLVNNKKEYFLEEFISIANIDKLSFR